MCSPHSNSDRGAMTTLIEMKSITAAMRYSLSLSAPTPQIYVCTVRFACVFVFWLSFCVVCGEVNRHRTAQLMVVRGRFGIGIGMELN